MEKKEKAILVLGIALILALAGGCYFASNTSMNITVPVNATAVNDNVNASSNSSEQAEAALWDYQANNLSEFNFPDNHRKYVMPDNPVVQEYAKQLKIGLYWEYLTYENDSALDLNYQNDTEEGIWQNPDYTLTIGYGDCEDIALAICSILKAKGIKSVVVIGYHYNDAEERNGHAWVEYYLDGKYYISDQFSFERNIVIENKIIYYFSPKITVTSNQTKEEILTIPPFKYQPRYIFNDKLKKRPYLKDWALSGLEI